ncbi:DUF6746 family protein [Halochromatium glycolicum]|uniref:Cytochrome b562 n=1 Tax=Halochromatium glycolicum TaxID=85075 RepID=A0AAJ0XD06_9GAMM|nr:DUF6746 family protein [Halochromatium glycolicum]MBK1707302.1 hypothetical protein [Halochromatium glycolicum]
MKFIYPSLALVLIVAASIAGSVAADEMSPKGRPHFEGKQAETFAEALTNFETANEQLEEYLEEDSLEPADLAHIHELTYTLENALEMIRSELSDLAITLEEVHLGSERGDTEIVLEAGRNYLSVTEQFDD